ncbi:hypothetical protein J6590_097600, partial [Homalodisca vitripennis]
FALCLDRLHITIRGTSLQTAEYDEGRLMYAKETQNSLQRLAMDVAELHDHRGYGNIQWARDDQCRPKISV